MTTELCCLITLTLWGLVLIYIGSFGKLRVGGLAWGVGNREGSPPELPEWVKRAERALANHKENLPFFVVAVVALLLTSQNDAVSAAAAIVFVVARVAHGLLYVAGVIGPRTAAYVVALGALFVMLSRLAF